MKKAIVAILVVLVVVGVAIYILRRPKPAPRAATLLPDTTILYAAFPDFTKNREQFRQTQLYALWQEPEVQAFLEKPRAVLRDAFGAGKSESLLDAFLQERVIGLLQGEVFVAVTRINPPPVGFVVGADVKGKRLETQAFLKILEHDLARRFPGSTAAEKRYLGTNYEVWLLDDKTHVCHAFLNSLLVLTLDENLLRDLITRFADQAPADAKTLSANAGFQNALQHAPANHEAIAYLNIQQLLGVFGPLLALSPQTGGAFQKIATLKSSATTVTFADGLVEDVSLLAYTGTNHVAQPPIQRGTLALTSPDTSLYTVHAIDLAAAYRQGMDSIALSGVATLTAAATQFDRNLSQRGIRLADDVLAHIGPEVALIGTWREGANLPDVALVAEVKDATALRLKLDSAMDAALTPWDAQSYLGENLHIHYFGANVVSPSYVVTDKFLIMSLTADYTRALVAQSKGNLSTLIANADFTGALKRVPTATTSFTYCDVPRVVSALYTLARANAVPNEYVDFSKLPQASTLTKHLTPFVSATVDTPTQQTTTTFSSLGKPLTFIVGVAGAFAAAQPLLAGLPEGSYSSVAQNVFR